MHKRYLRFFKAGKYAQHLPSLPIISVSQNSVLCLDDKDISEETAEHLVKVGRAKWCGDDVKKGQDEAESIIKKAQDDAAAAKAQDDAAAAKAQDDAAAAKAQDDAAAAKKAKGEMHDNLVTKRKAGK